MTVEDYYGFQMRDGSMVEGAVGENNLDRKISFKQFMETRSSPNVFDNDVSMRSVNLSAS
jgi:hypothetical protein